MNWVTVWFTNNCFTFMPVTEAFSAMGAIRIAVTNSNGSFVYVRRTGQYDDAYWRCVSINGEDR